MAHVRRNLPDPRVDAQDRHARGLVLREVEDVEERDARAPHGEIGIVLDVAVLAAEFQRVVASGHGNRIDPVKRVLDEHGRVRRQIAEADHPVVEVDVRHPLVVRQQPAVAAAEPETHLVDRGVGDDPRMTDRGVVTGLVHRLVEAVANDGLQIVRNIAIVDVAAEQPLVLRQLLIHPDAELVRVGLLRQGDRGGADVGDAVRRGLKSVAIQAASRCHIVRIHRNRRVVEDVLGLRAGDWPADVADVRRRRRGRKPLEQEVPNRARELGRNELTKLGGFDGSHQGRPARQPQAFVGGEIKQLVPHHRAAVRRAELVESQRILLGGQRALRVEPVVAHELVRRAVLLVGPRLRDDVHRRRAVAAEFRGEVVGRDAELLDDVDVRVDGDATRRELIVVVGAVEHEVVRAVTLAVDERGVAASSTTASGPSTSFVPKTRYLRPDCARSKDLPRGAPNASLPTRSQSRSGGSTPA